MYTFNRCDITCDHISGFQTDYIEESPVKPIHVDAKLSFPHIKEPMYENIEKCAYSRSDVANIMVFRDIFDTDSTFSRPARMSCIYDKDGKLHSPSKDVPAVVFDADSLRHLVWYKHGVPHREEGLPNYIIDYEEFEHNTLMFHFNADYKLDDVINEDKPNMPAEILFSRVPRHGLYLELAYYKNGVENKRLP